MDVEALRISLNLKPSQFARELGVSPGYAADLRSGRRPPSIAVAAQLDRLAGEPRFLPSALSAKMHSSRAA